MAKRPGSRGPHPSKAGEFAPIWLAFQRTRGPGEAKMRVLRSGIPKFQWLDDGVEFYLTVADWEDLTPATLRRIADIKERAMMLYSLESARSG